jgi:hypothetical protein
MSVQSAFNDMPAIGFAGQLTGSTNHVIDSAKNADSVSIAYGFAVAFKPSGATSDQDATLPANSSDSIKGIVFKSDVLGRTYSIAGGGTGGELDSVGVVATGMMSTLIVGEMLATCEDGCTPGARLWVRYTSAGTGKGTLRASDAGGSTCIDATKQGEWLTTATAGGIAKLRVNFVNKP